MGVALDGSASNLASSGSCSVVLTTTQPNDLIVVDIECDGGPVVSVVATAPGLSGFTQHAGAGTNHSIERWEAIALLPLSGVTITVNDTSGADFQAVTAYGISGANLSSPWDAGGPVIANGDPQPITTVNANTLVIATYVFGSTASPTAGAGFTQIAPLAGSFQLCEYQPFAGPGTLSCTVGTGAGLAGGVILDAVVPAIAAAAASPPFGIVGMASCEW